MTSQARYIWSDEAGEGLNRYVMFRRTFDLGDEPSSASFRIFADTRYKLSVNGAIVGHGPGRFFLVKPEYDTWDIAPFLRSGRNVVAVLVNSYGRYTYHSQYSHGGLIAWADVTDASGNHVSLISDGSWKALDAPDREPETCHVSFVLNPGELIDARKTIQGWEGTDFDDSQWPAAVELADQGHWGQLVPRTIPMLDERRVMPRKRCATWVAQYAEPEDIYSFILVAKEWLWRHPAPSLALTYIHSPRAQRVTMGAWGSRYWMNGQELQAERRSDLHLRHDVTADLKEGWNCFQVVGPLLNGAWEFYLGLPRRAGLSVSAEKELDSAHTFLLAGPWEGERGPRGEALSLPLDSPDDLPEDLGPWRRWPRSRSANSPFAERAWMKTTAIPGGAALEVCGADYAATVGRDALVLTFDFGTEVLGRPALDMTAAAGTVVDLMYSEKLEDGVPVHYHRYEVRLAERYIAREGRQTYRTFHPRGFRWLEVLVRGNLQAFHLHGLSATRANYPVEPIGRFQCSDPTLNAIWELGPPTLFACMEDAYLDCPRRERGSYAGDNMPQFYTHMATFGDTRLMRRCVEQILLSQGDSGLVSPCAHSPWPGRHPDYSAITVQGLWHYYARTGDAEFLREMKPRLEKLMGGLLALKLPDVDLLDGSEMQPYLDLSHLDRDGASCALNCFYQRAFHDAALIMGVLGDQDAAARYGDMAERMAEAIRGEYWDGERGCFVDRRKADKPSTGPSAPANILPLLYDIAGEQQVDGALQYVVDAMEHNFRVPNPKRNVDFNVTSYFSFYGMGVLYKYGKVEEAERYMRKCWGLMLDKNAHTTWEYFIDRYSQCHAWSTCPTHYLSTEILGVGFPEAGNPNRVRIEPHPGALSWAEGVYPHPAGPIKVKWQVVDGRLDLECEAPEGIDLEIASEA